MNTYLSRTQLKDYAKSTLAGHYGLLIASSLLIGALSILVSYVIAVLIPAVASPAGILISLAVSFLVSVFINVFKVGVSLMYLKYACGSQASLADIFYGFSNHLETSLILSMVLTAISSIPSMAYEIPYRLYLATMQTRYLYATFALGLAAVAVCIPLSLIFSQCLFIMLDFPDKSAKEVLSLSARVMKGQKLRLFILELSFLPIMLLGVVSSIGILWVAPYMQMTYAHFYFDIMKPGR